MKIAVVQDLYKCDTCKNSKDMYGRMCQHGALFPLLLVMADKDECPNYTFDKIKVEEQLKAIEEDQ